MTIKGKAYIAGVFEHPTRLAPDKTVAQLHAEVALGALADAGLTRADVDGYFCSGDAPGPGPASMAEYMNLKLRHVDSTEVGGASYTLLAAHAAEAIALGKCDVALVTLAGRPRSEGMATGTAPRARPADQPEAPWEAPYAITTANGYAMCAMRHMHEYGTTSEQLAWVKVAASHHAQYNPHAMLPEVVTVEDVVNSPMIADPLHRLDCCVISDGGGALVIVRPEIAKKLKRPLVKIIGAGEAVKHLTGGSSFDLTTSGAARALGTEAEVFELDDHGDGEAVVDRGVFDVGRRHAGFGEGDRPGAGGARRGEIEAAASQVFDRFAGADDFHQRPLELFGDLRPHDDQRAAAVADDAAIESVQRVGDHR